MAASDRLTLGLTRTLPAAREEVWRALTDSGELAKWWGPKGFTAPSVDFDAKPGGAYRIAMQPPEGELFHLYGEFREIEPPARLSYTFCWDPPTENDRETVVALTLEGKGEQTEVKFTQGEFANEERRALHEGGWTDAFERLEELLR